MADILKRVVIEGNKAHVEYDVELAPGKRSEFVVVIKTPEDISNFDNEAAIIALANDRASDIKAESLAIEAARTESEISEKDEEVSL